MTVAEPRPLGTDDPLAAVRSWLEEMLQYSCMSSIQARAIRLSASTDSVGPARGGAQRLGRFP